MTDTGWPLIPREVLPAPVPAVRRRTVHHARPDADPGRQLSIFGAETIEPSPADLAGLLAGPGRLDRMGGTARVSVPVDAAWRVHVLVAEFGARGLAAAWVPLIEPPSAIEDQEDQVRDGDPPPPSEAIDGSEDPHAEAPPPSAARFEVRTAYSSRLNGLARAWPAAAAQLFLSGPRLRLWVAAAGAPRPGGYALGLDPGKAPQAVEAALVRAGLAGRVSSDGRLYSISGRRRLARLAELVGERPAAAPAEFWPSGAAA